MKHLVLRAETDDTGYLFDRHEGTAKLISGAEFQRQKSRAIVHFVPSAANGAKRARAAPHCVWFELTRRCSLQCQYCGALSPAIQDTNPLTTKQIGKIFEDMANCGVFEMRFTGGEPTLHRDFSQIVELANKEYGFFVSLNSNGCMSDSLRDSLLTLPIGLYIISLDGPKAVNDQLRPPNSYAQIIRTIQVLANAGKRVRVNAVLCKANRKRLDELVALLITLKVEGATLVPLRPAGSAAGRFPMMALSRHEYGQVLEEVRRLRTTHSFDIAASYDTMSSGQVFNTPSYFTKRCVAGVESACLAPDGNLRACILMDGPSYVVGSLVKEPFSRLWAEDDLWGIFRDEARLSRRCQDCDHFSRQCPGTCHAITEHLGAPEQDPYCQIPDQQQ